MINEEKIREARKSLNRGEPEGEIRECLAKEGYSKEDIDQVFAPHKYDMRSWYLLFGCVLFIWGFLIYAKTNSILLLILSGLLFVQYYRETERLKKEAKKKQDGQL
jgi:hypothetical protein